MKLKKYSLVLLCFTLITSLVMGCQRDQTVKSASKKKVYTSIYPVYDFTQKIAGDKIEVKNLIPAGTEPHDWEPTAKELAEISDADMLIYNGLGMESWIDKVKESVGNDKLLYLQASEGIDLIESHSLHDHDEANNNEEAKHNEDVHEEDAHVETGHQEDVHAKAGHEEDVHEQAKHEEANGEDHDGHNHGNYDPHVWTSPKSARIMAKNIKDELIKLDPDNKEYYEENYQKYDSQLADLDKEMIEGLKDLSSRTIVVQHEAYGYLTRDYNLVQKGIQGLSPDGEPDPDKMKEIIDFAKENKVKVIFFEELVSPKVAKVIAKDLGIEAKLLNPVEGLTQDQIDDGQDYISVMKENLKVLIDALK